MEGPLRATPALVCHGLFLSDLRERASAQQESVCKTQLKTAWLTHPWQGKLGSRVCRLQMNTRSSPRHSEDLGPPSPGEPWLNFQRDQAMPCVGHCPFLGSSEWPSAAHSTSGEKWGRLIHSDPAPSQTLPGTTIPQSKLRLRATHSQVYQS